MIPLYRERGFFDESFVLPSRFAYSTKAFQASIEPALKAAFEMRMRRLAKYYKLLRIRYPNAIKDQRTWKIKFQHNPHPDKSSFALMIDEVISLQASSVPAINAAFSSLEQILLVAIKGDGNVSMQELFDFPEYQWRGLHLDESRHFFGLSHLKSFLHTMASLKLNTLHWHLTDDQGWRIQSKRFPMLSKIGSIRKMPDGSIYKGHYSQAQIKEAIRYAANLGISIVPEIDLPGHCVALLSAYPQYACVPGDFEPLNVWGISEDILCAGKDDAISFVKELLTEIAELFPSPFIHLGGDEVPKQRWKACPACQDRINKEHLADEEALQAWFGKQMTDHLETKGKTVIGWDEILDGGIDDKAIVMVWRGDGKASVEKALANGNRVVLCPNSYLYLDWKEARDKQGAHGISSLENVFSYRPPTFEDESKQELILGAQANIWTEYIHNPTELRNMMLPRAIAMAEWLWNPQDDWQEFLQRKELMGEYLDTVELAMSSKIE